MKADFIFVNGKVHTIDPNDRVSEAAAVAGNRILAVGSTKEIRAMAKSGAKTYDLAGRTLLPGFNDAHCHPGYYGAIKLQIQCGPDKMDSIEDLKAEIRRRAQNTPKGQWILGRGYDEKHLLEKRHPTRWDLDEAAPEHRVFITRTCGHMSVANSLILKEFNIDRNTPDPPGGRIEHDSSGEVTGLLLEKAHYPIRMSCQPSYPDLEQGMRNMSDYFLSLGITSAQDASGRNADEIILFQRGVAEGWLKVRIYFMVRSMGDDVTLGRHLLKTGLMTGFGNEKLRLGSYKLMMDGAGSAGSAAMRQPYPNDPQNYGLLHMPPEELDQEVLRGHMAGCQVAVHAIGDRAVEITLDSFEKALTAHPRVNHRHRIEHCGLLDQEMIARMKRLGVLAASGLPFLYELGDSYIGSLGQERAGAFYPLRSMLDQRVKAALSSDAPVMDPNPMHGLYCAVARKTASGQDIGPEQTVSLREAVAAYTIEGAYASFEEDIKGSIEPGKLADVVVLSGDLFAAPLESILDFKADLTMIDGQVVYERN